MKQPSIYLKMRVLGAIDTAPGKTRHERVHQVAATTCSEMLAYVNPRTNLAHCFACNRNRNAIDLLPPASHFWNAG